MSSYIHRFRAFLRGNDTARGLLIVAIVLLSAIGIWYGVRWGLNTEYPVLVVSSGSMCEPNNCTLPVGDLIVIRGQDPATIQAGPPCTVPIGTAKYGSIIVYRDPSRGADFLIVHRVREILGNKTVGFSFKTQGDNYQTNKSCDPIVPASRVVGVYQYSIPIPYLGSAILAVRGFMYNETTGQLNPQGIAVIVSLILALLAFEVLEPGKKKTPTPTSTPAPSSPVVQPSAEDFKESDGS